MCGALDLCPLVVAAVMPGDDPLAIDDPNFFWIGEHGQGALHLGVGIGLRASFDADQCPALCRVLFSRIDPLSPPTEGEIV